MAVRAPFIVRPTVSRSRKMLTSSGTIPPRIHAMSQSLPRINPEDVTSDDGSIWIYGYGSIMAKPNFPHSNRIEGYIVGYKRVFWQGSTDHRGTPESPGRTVTLSKAAEGQVWGVAFQLAGTPEVQRETLAYLEWREKQYDLRERVDIYSQDGKTIIRGALCYIASDSPSNVNYLGPAPVEDIAQQIAMSHGPSGPNHEYLFGIADALRSMGQTDSEIFFLEEMVLSIMAARKTANQMLEDASDASVVDITEM